MVKVSDNGAGGIEVLIDDDTLEGNQAHLQMDDEQGRQLFTELAGHYMGPEARDAFRKAMGLQPIDTIEGVAVPARPAAPSPRPTLWARVARLWRDL